MVKAADRFSGFSQDYNQYRPKPPEVIISTLSQLSGVDRPSLVVDLGCGTGISTRPWADIADMVVGIDPSVDMIQYAQKMIADRNVHFRIGSGESIDLDSNSTDIVTCSSSIHWMDPEITFAGIAKILRNGGVFGAYGPQLPYLPISNWQLAVVFNDFLEAIKHIDQTMPDTARPISWKWANILSYAKSCRKFSYVDELCFHHHIELTAMDFIQWVQTISYVKNLVKDGHDVALSAYNIFCKSVHEIFGSNSRSFLLSYRMITAIK